VIYFIADAVDQQECEVLNVAYRNYMYAAVMQMSLIDFSIPSSNNFEEVGL